jgi:TatD DNase family protein
MLIDTHCHLNFQAYKDDADDVIRRALDSGVQMIIPATEQKTAKRAVAIAEKYESGVYAAIGLHPVHLQNQEFEEEGRKVKMKGERFEREDYARLAASDKVVAIGEVGLDYHYLPAETDNITHNKQLQQLTLLQQLELAYELNKPVVIHCREAHEGLQPLLQKFYQHKPARGRSRGVIHDFFGDWDLAWQYFNLGFLISFTGNITFPPKKDVPRLAYIGRDDLIRKCPLDKFMIETDAPFMSPVPYRGERNEPARVIEIAKKIAELKNVSIDTVADATTKNAQRLFGILQ